MSKESKYLTQTESKAAASKDRLEMPIHTIDNLVPVEELGNQQTRRVVPVEAAGEPSQIALTSKVNLETVSHRAKCQTRSLLLRSKKVRSRKSRKKSKPNLKLRLKK